jgi:hypothetical protein
MSPKSWGGDKAWRVCGHVKFEWKVWENMHMYVAGYFCKVILGKIYMWESRITKFLFNQ